MNKSRRAGFQLCSGSGWGCSAQPSVSWASVVPLKNERMESQTLKVAFSFLRIRSKATSNFPSKKVSDTSCCMSRWLRTTRWPSVGPACSAAPDHPLVISIGGSELCCSLPFPESESKKLPERAIDTLQMGSHRESVLPILQPNCQVKSFFFI